jgi:hypothetical protein
LGLIRQMLTAGVLRDGVYESTIAGKHSRPALTCGFAA